MFFFYLLAWRRAFDFRGSSTRQAFWLFMLLHVLITLTLIWLDIVMKGAGWFDALYEVASIIPMIAIIIRRLHDSGRSGWWGWVFFIPVAGPFMLVYLLSRAAMSSDYLEEMAS
ncbi:DUF805 domain-containing protein [Aeromonas cavernicola]|uniref:DUF805 domain-containing protein n=1 Tax=Aeromonas cavernicola TaxID=1006623 RepID=A0A2H9U4R6_9GAMM|nr:DUF805 domain-containing protein [Aeromonas cavernicola]PJG58969.1 DUF805 domain-containing protein [Aeromonas cavernicola]